MSEAKLLPTRTVAKPWGCDTLPAPFVAPPGERIGEIWFEPDAGLSQLLVKYLFTSEKLSVQVHPSDAQAPAGELVDMGLQPLSALGGERDRPGHAGVLRLRAFVVHGFVSHARQPGRARRAVMDRGDLGSPPGAGTRQVGGFVAAVEDALAVA